MLLSDRDLRAEIDAGRLAVDPFDDKPLRVRRTPSGPIVYSVDENLKDDGGVWRPPTADNFESWKPDDAALGPPETGPTK